MRILAAVAVFVITASPLLLAQWPKFVPPNAPTLADGRINLAGPPPRAPPTARWICPACGKQTRGVGAAARPLPPTGTGELPPSGSIFGNVGDQVPGGAPYQPWAAALVKTRMADNSKDNPDAHCLPMGLMR